MIGIQTMHFVGVPVSQNHSIIGDDRGGNRPTNIGPPLHDRLYVHLASRRAAAGITAPGRGRPICFGQWGMICLDGTEGALVCDVNNPFNPYIVLGATPCLGNSCPPLSVDDSTWGRIKAIYR